MITPRHRSLTEISSNFKKCINAVVTGKRKLHTAYFALDRLSMFASLFVLGLLFPVILLAQTPQGSLSANGPFCGSGAGMLTWTASAGPGPFKVVYNDGASNRTATNVVSGTPFGVFTTPVSGTTTYTLVSVTDANAQVRTSGFTTGAATITVKPQPNAIATPASQTICSGSNLATIALTSSMAGASISWTRDNISGVTGTGGVEAFSGTGNISGAFTSTATSAKTVGFQVTASSDGCSSAPVAITVTVSPAPTVDAVADQAVCPGSNTTAVAFTGNATSFNWTNNNTTIGLAASGTGNIASFSAVNNTGSVKTATISVMPVSTNTGTCTGIPRSFTISVNPTAALSSSLSPSARCSGALFNYTPATNATGITATFSWSRAVVSGISNEAATGTGSISETLINTTSSTKNVTYVYTVSSSGNGLNCSNPATYEVVVPIKPTPTTGFSGSANQNTCSGSNIKTITITNPNGVAGTTFSWERTNGDLATGTLTGMPASGTGNSISGSLTNTGLVLDTAKFTLKAISNGCFSTNTTNVIVGAPITDNKILSSQISELSICGLQKQITIASNAPKGGNGKFQYQWQVSSPGNNAFTDITNADDSGLVYKTSTSGYYRLLVTSGGCKDTSEERLISGSGGNTSTVIKECTGGSGVDIGVVASYKDLTYTLQNDNTGSWINVAGQSPITGTGYKILFENNKLLGNYRVLITGSGGCSAMVSGTTQIVAGEIPEKPSSATATPASICAGSSANLVAIVPGATVANGAAVNWYTVPSGGEGISLEPVPSGAPYLVSPDITTTYYAKSIFTATGCKSSTRTAVTVIVNPLPLMTSLDSTGVCSGTVLSVPLTSDIGAGVTYSWMATDNPNTAGESTSAQNSATLANTIMNNTDTTQTVVYSVTPRITATGCMGFPQELKVTVSPTPVIPAQGLTVCSGVGFTLTPANGGDTIVPGATQYSWAAPAGSGFSGGAAGSGASFTGLLTNTGVNAAIATYSVIPSAGSCMGTPFSVTVSVNIAPVIADQYVAVCDGVFSLPPFSGSNLIPAGTTYTWQPPTGTNISGIAAGSNEATVHGALTNTSSPSVPVTATYIVAPDAAGCAGSPFTLIVDLNLKPSDEAVVWTGLINSDWCNADNWACGGVPTATTNVVIPAGTAHQPEITSACIGSVRNIDVQGTATLTVGSGSNLNIFGSIINKDEDRYILNGKVTFAGGNQDIPGFTYNGLGVTGGGDKLLLAPAIVTGNLDLDNGIIKSTNALTLTIGGSGTATPGSNLSYVDGPLTRLTNSTGTYNFPVGGDGSVRPATVTPLNNAASSYTVFYHPAATTGNVPGPELLAIQSNEYWDITRNSGADATVEMYYKNPNALAAGALTTDWSNGMNPCDACNVALAIKNAETWNFTGTGTGNFAPNETTYWQSNGFVSSRQLLGNAGQFTFGYSQSVLLAVQLLSFNGILQGDNSLIDWKFASGAEVISTEIQHSTDGRRFEKLAVIDAGTRNDYNYSHRGIKPGAHFYRLYIKDKEGKLTYSRTVLLIAGKSITVIKGLRPTMVNSLTYVEIHSAMPQAVNATLVDVTGRTIAHQKGNLLAGDNSFRVNTQMLARGIYSIRLQTTDGVVETFRFVKE